MESLIMEQEASIEDFQKLLVRLNDRPVTPKHCKFSKWLNSLPSDKAEIVQIMLDSDLNHAELWRELETVITTQLCKDTMRTHRQGTCACR
jgi:hypothetical protein